MVEEKLPFRAMLNHNGRLKWEKRKKNQRRTAARALVLGVVYLPLPVTFTKPQELKKSW